MPRRVDERDRGTLRDAEQREAIEAGGGDHRLEVGDPGVERELARLAVGEPAPALVVADERVAVPEPGQPVAPDRALPVEIEVRQPGRCSHDRRSAAVYGVGQLHAVPSRAEANLLLHGVAGQLVGDIEAATACRADQRLPPWRNANRRHELRCRQVQARVLTEDPQLELPHRRSRVDADLLDERPASALEHAERVGLPSAAVEREHQLAARTLAEAVFRDEPLELRHQLVMAAKRQVGINSILDRRETQVVQPRNLALCERLASELDQRLPAPKRERITQAGRPLVWILELARSRDQRLEASQVDLARRDLQQITGRAGLDPIGAEQLAQAGDVPVQRGLRGARRLLAPQRLDQLGARHDLAAAQEQQRQQRALLRARRGHIGVTFDNPQRTQQLEPHLAGFSHAFARR
jgi:hypothetical protein